MTLLKFYFYFGVFIETLPLLPIFFGLRKWSILSLGVRFILLFLISEFLLNCLTNYYLFYLDRNNLTLFYFYSFFQSSFILFGFYNLTLNKNVRLSIIILWVLSVSLLIFDFLFISKIGYNYVSNFCVNLIISGLSFYYFYITFTKSPLIKSLIEETMLILSTALILQFFIRAINIFIEKNMLETQNNAFLVIQTRNVYSYFMLIALIIYTYAFYNLKVNEK